MQLDPVVEDELLSSINPAFDSWELISALEFNVLVRPQGSSGMIVAAVSPNNRKISITLQTLFKLWGIGLKISANTLRAMAQMGYWSQ